MVYHQPILKTIGQMMLHLDHSILVIVTSAIFLEQTKFFFFLPLDLAVSSARKVLLHFLHMVWPFSVLRTKNLSDMTLSTSFLLSLSCLLGNYLIFTSCLLSIFHHHPHGNNNHICDHNDNNSVHTLQALIVFLLIILMNITKYVCDPCTSVLSSESERTWT